MPVERSSSNSEGLNITRVSCPVCGSSFDGLTALNKHLDVDHGFNDGSAETINNPDNNTRTPKIQHIKKSHWEKADYGGTVCHECGISFKKAKGLINCRKCGKLYCSSHCRNIIKLNLKAEYDPTNGKWYACCCKCFIGKPGYCDYGSFLDVTDSFVNLRNKKNEDERLRTLQIENRLVRLVDGVADIHEKYRGSIFINFTMGNDISRLERTVAPWRDDRSVLDCFVCLKPFGLTFRKHHCRLCGNVVCNRDVTGCSNEISLQCLANAAIDLPFKRPIEKFSNVDYTLRLCYRCIKSLYGERKFKKDLHRPKPQLISLCESLQSTSEVINVIIGQMEGFVGIMDDPKTIDNLPRQEDMRESKRLRTKLLRTVAMYNSLTRQLSGIVPANLTEAKIKRSVQSASSGFINDKILRLKQVPGMKNEFSKDSSAPFLPQRLKSTDLLFNNLTISEVKKYREELMVLKEQKFLVQSMIEEAKKQRKFDEVAVLSSNLNELNAQITQTQNNLGDQGFS